MKITNIVNDDLSLSVNNNTDDYCFYYETDIFEKKDDIKKVRDDDVIVYILHVDSSDRDVWYNKLPRATKNNTEITKFITKLSKSINKDLNDKYINILKKTNDSYNSYIEESHNSDFAQPSLESLYQLARFIPDYPEENLDVFLDEKTGFFGVSIQSEKQGKPILNIVMKDNMELIFSFIKRNDKIIKISGRAYFNDDLSASSEINKILNMVSY